MVFVAVGEDDTQEVLAAFLDEGEIGEDKLDARVSGVGKGHAEVDHDPFAVAAVEVDVHADLARTAEREEEELFTGFHANS